jgi:predicted  nucleic acid-binding Zn-ribbon protein
MSITFVKDEDGRAVRTDKHYVKIDKSVDVAYYTRRISQIEAEITMLTGRKEELETELTALQEVLDA